MTPEQFNAWHLAIDKAWKHGNLCGIDRSQLCDEKKRELDKARDQAIKEWEAAEQKFIWLIQRGVPQTQRRHYDT